MLSRIEIKEELERFIEWPTDDHGSVSATSTALFAHHVQQKATEKLRAELERVTSELEQYKRDAERMREALESIRSMTSADDPESYRSDDREGCLDAVFRAAEQALSAQPDHIEDKLKMVRPELFEIPQLWSGSLCDCWPEDEEYPEENWIIGKIDEDGNKYPVITVEAYQYDAEGHSEQIAKAIIALWAAVQPVKP